VATSHNKSRKEVIVISSKMPHSQCADKSYHLFEHRIQLTDTNVSTTLHCFKIISRYHMKYEQQRKVKKDRTKIARFIAAIIEL